MSDKEPPALDSYFGDLDEGQLRHLVAVATYESFREGEILARQGEPGERAFILLDGEVEISISRNGKKRCLGSRGQGHILGEMALLEEKPRTATLKALTAVNAFVLTRHAFQGLLENQPGLSLAINRSLSARMRVAQETLFNDLMSEIERLEAELAACRLQLE